MWVSGTQIGKQINSWIHKKDVPQLAVQVTLGLAFEKTTYTLLKFWTVTQTSSFKVFTIPVENQDTLSERNGQCQCEVASDKCPSPERSGVQGQ